MRRTSNRRLAQLTGVGVLGPYYMMKRLIVLGSVLVLAGAWVVAGRGTRQCVIRRPANLTAGVVVPRIAELRPMLQDAASRLEPKFDATTDGRRLHDQLEQLGASLDRGTSDERCRALNASLETFAKLDAAPGSAHKLNALALTLDLTALALIDSQVPTSASAIPSRSNP